MSNAAEMHSLQYQGNAAEESEPAYRSMTKRRATSAPRVVPISARESLVRRDVALVELNRCESEGTHLRRPNVEGQGRP